MKNKADFALIAKAAEEMSEAAHRADKILYKHLLGRKIEPSCISDFVEEAAHAAAAIDVVIGMLDNYLPEDFINAKFQVSRQEKHAKLAILKFNGGKQ